MSEPHVVMVHGLQKSYGGRKVVEGLDLEVATGEIVGLIGANGAGKTTTVECIQGLRRPDAGTIRVLGLDPVTEVGGLRPESGSQLQDSAVPARCGCLRRFRRSGPAATSGSACWSSSGWLSAAVRRLL